MRCVAILYCVCLATSPAGILAQAPPAASNADHQAIRRVLDDQEKAWNRGDLEAYMGGYWKADDLTFFSGTVVARGYQATLDRFRKRYQADGKEMGKVTFRDVTIELLGKEAAWVRGRWELVQTKEKHGGLFTLILKKQPEGWRIVHDHTSGE